MKQLCFAIDADGTIFSNEFPNKGKEIGAERVLKKVVEAGHLLMLYTCRCNIEEDRIMIFEDGSELRVPAGNHLDEAIDWFSKYNLPIIGVNWNPAEAEYSVTKPHFDILIDDKAFGIPLTSITIVDGEYVSSNKPFVDWDAIELDLMNKGII